MKKKLLFFITTAIIILTFSMSVSAAGNTNEFAGGSGTQNNPYLIETKDQLNNVRNHLNSYFKVTADIEFTAQDFSDNGSFYNNGACWIPIGTETSPFTGIFDGNNHIISGLSCNVVFSKDEVLPFDNYVYAGLFGYNKGTVKNVILEKGKFNAEAIPKDSGYMPWHEINAGSCVGFNDETGIVSHCYNNGNVRSASSFGEECLYYAGGLIGKNNGKLENSYNSGNVNAEPGSSADAWLYAYAGGLVGKNDEKGIINNCYNTGNVTAVTSDYNDFVCSGGLVGENAKGTINNSYNVGSVNASNTSESIYGVNLVGGIIGFYNDGKVNNCYYLDNVSTGAGEFLDSDDYSNLGKKCTNAEMKKQNTYNGFDFTSIWAFDTSKGYSYPQLKWSLKKEVIPPDVPSIKFTDVPVNAWFAPFVYDLADQGIISGMTKTTFVPNGLITRAQFAKILAAASGENISAYAGKTSFSDVSSSAWYASYVQWAYEKGIVKGISDTSFAPEANITREQMAAMIFRYAAYKKVTLPQTNAKLTFKDDKAIGNWAKSDVYAMQQAGIINGYADGSGYIFKPKGNATRAEAATMVSIFLAMK